MPANTYGTATSGSSQIKRSQSLKLHCTKADLFQGIQTVQSAISQRSTLPVLGNILFEADDQGLRLSATDLEVGIRTWVKADVIEKGAVTIPAKIFADFLRTLEDNREIKLEVSENSKIEIRSGRDRLNVTGLPKEDYPVLPEFDESKSVAISKTVIREMVKKTMFAASADETRYVLNGVHFILEKGKATGVATDGRRLAYIQRPIADKGLQIKVIVPTKAVQELVRLVSDEKKTESDDLKVSFTDNQASFSDGTTVILSRLIEGHFPNFEQVIPKTKDIQLRLDRTQLLASVTRAAVGTLERGGSVRLSLTKGALRIQAAAQGRVEVESEVATNYEGPEFEVAFNPAYLSDVLKALETNDIVIELTTPLNPGVIRPADDESYRYVMMPMKL
ncbi:MAG: DNA polymerase III subunit beta [Elusimicrobia bacterium]|nr:DNA polymerase III subunit beta [Elusimicrobiota bacterium]